MLDPAARTVATTFLLGKVDLRNLTPEAELLIANRLVLADSFRMWTNEARRAVKYFAPTPATARLEQLLEGNTLPGVAPARPASTYDCERLVRASLLTNIPHAVLPYMAATALGLLVEADAGTGRLFPLLIKQWRDRTSELRLGEFLDAYTAATLETR